MRLKIVGKDWEGLFLIWEIDEINYNRQPTRKNGNMKIIWNFSYRSWKPKCMLNNAYETFFSICTFCENLYSVIKSYILVWYENTKFHCALLMFSKNFKNMNCNYVLFKFIDKTRDFNQKINFHRMCSSVLSYFSEVNIW